MPSPEHMVAVMRAYERRERMTGTYKTDTRPKYDPMLEYVTGMPDESLTRLATLVAEQMAARGLDTPPWEAPRELGKQHLAQDAVSHQLGDGPRSVATLPTGRFDGASTEPLHIWVDGSFDKRTKAYSYGMVVEGPDGADEFYAKRFGEDAASSMHNVAGELAGAKAALAYASDHKAGHVVIHHDYTGIGEWGDRNWKAKNPHTQAYQSLVEGLRMQGMRIEFSHVSGHTGVPQNEKCDELAKHALGIELSDDMKVQGAGPYVSREDKSATIQSAISKASQDFGFSGEQLQM